MNRFWRLALANVLTVAAASAQDPSVADPPADSARATMSAAGTGPMAGLTPGPLLPLEPAYAGMSAEGLFAKMLEYDQMRDAHLLDFS